jgi:tetratricopeptide (TPR) repeat protein
MRLTLLFILFSLFACAQKPAKKEVNQQAKKLVDSAVYKAAYQQDYQQAILLLNKAIEIDNDYFLAHLNKLTFQVSLKDYKAALQTATHLIRLKPEVPDYYVTVGLLNKMDGNNIAFTDYLQKAVIKFETAIDKTDKNDYRYSMLLVNKAVALILIDKAEEGKQILSALYKEEKDELKKEMIAQFMNKTKEEIFLLLLNPHEEEQTSSPIVQ